MAQQTSELWKSIYAMRGTTHQYMFDINGTIYGPESEVSHSLSNGLYEEFGIGNASSAKITLSFYADNVPRSATIKRYIRLVNADADLVSEWIPKGVFYTSSRTEDDGLWTIDAFDAMRKAERTWVPAGDENTFPMTMPDVVEELAGIIGVEIDPRTTLNPDYTVDEYPYDDDYSIRDMLRYIAAAHGGNWVITDVGKLLLVPLFSAPPGTGYLVTEYGAAITLGGTKLIVDEGWNVPASASGKFSRHHVGLDLTGLRKNSVQRPISKVTLNGYEFQKKSQKEYRTLEYIEFTGTQYINTAVFPTQNTQVIVDFMGPPANTSPRYIFGAIDAEGNAYQTMTQSGGESVMDYYGKSDALIQNVKTADTRITIKKNKNKFTAGSVSHTSPASTFEVQCELYIGAQCKFGPIDTDTMCPMRLYAFKIYEDNVLVRDYSPAVNEFDVVGLYDRVEKKFYENIGEGEFNPGPVAVESANTKTLFAYTAGDDSGMEIVADCPFATQEMVDVLLEEFQGGKYEMYIADDVNVDPAMELGDGISLGSIYSVIAQVEDDGTGWPSLSQPGKTELEDEYPYKSPEKRKRVVLENKVDDLELKIEEIGDMIENLGVEAGVISFNGRTGIVNPEVGDYTDEISEAIRYAIIESWNTQY